MARPPARRRGRLVRSIMLAVGGVVVLAIAGIAVFIATFDPNSRKPQIIAAVQAATGRELTIGGRIGLSISLQPTLEVSDVSFSNPPGFSRPQMATVQELELQLALIPLLSKEIRVVHLVARKPDLLLETNTKGQSNWDFSPVDASAGRPVGGPAGAAVGGPAGGPAGLPGAPPPPPSSASSSSATGNGGATRPPSVALSSVKIEGGTLAMRDAAGQTIALALKALTAQQPAPDAPLHLTLDAAYNGAPVSLTADTGPLAGLLAGGAAPWPVKLAVSAGGAKLGVDGSVAEPAAGRGLAIALTADVPDLAALSALAGTALPPLKTVALQLRLADMDGGNGIAVSDLKLTLPNADLAGSLSIQRGVRPLVKANLSAKRVDLDALTRAMSAAAPAAPGKPVAPDTREERSGRVIPDTRLPFSVLRLADSDIQLAVDDLRSGQQDYKSIKLHAVTKDGRLTLDPLTLDVPGGLMDLKATVDAKPATPPVTLTLRTPGLALQALLKALDKPGYASGTLELRADLSGAGDTPHAIIASLDGAVGAVVVKGEIDSKLLGNVMSGLLQKTELTQLAGKVGMSALNCFAMRLDASNGVGTLRALRLDTSTFGITGGGTLNFGAETLDLHLRPTAGIAGTTITAPVIIEGTFADPSIHADMVGAVTGNAGTAAKLALGASTGGVALIIGSALDKKLSSDQCAEALALARFLQPPAASGVSAGSAPPAGQPPAKPANNPVNALKKLFQ